MELIRPYGAPEAAASYWAFLAVAGFYLITEHTIHVLGALPFLLLLSCPLMHLFMHHGHGGQDSASGPPPPSAEDDGDQRGAP